MHYHWANSYLSVNGTKIIKFEAKDFEIVAYPLCLGNISKDISLDYVKTTELNKCVYNFSVNYDAFSVDDILEMHKYLMEKHDIK